MSVLKLMNLEEEMIIKVEYSGYEDSPRVWDNLGTFYTWVYRSMSPDKNNFNDGLEFIESVLGENTTHKLHAKNSNTSDFMSDVIPRLDKLGYILYPVSKYEHGQVIYSLGCSSGWDTGTVGVIFAEKEKIREEFGVKNVTKKIREKVEKNFINELNLYTQWCNGEVYSFTIEDLTGSVIDSYGGIYDDMWSKDLALQTISEYEDIGDINNWEEYSKEKFHNKYGLKTVLVRK